MFFKFLAEVQRGLSVRTTHTFRRGETPRKTRGPVRGLAQLDWQCGARKLPQRCKAATCCHGPFRKSAGGRARRHIAVSTKAEHTAYQKSQLRRARRSAAQDTTKEDHDRRRPPRAAVPDAAARARAARPGRAPATTPVGRRRAAAGAVRCSYYDGRSLATVGRRRRSARET